MQDSITRFQQAEAALRQSEARFQRIAASVPGVIYQFLQHPDGTVAFPFVSPSCLRFYEVEASEIEADASVLISMIHPEDVEDFNHSVNLSAKFLQPWSWEGRFILRSGQLKWIQAASVPQRQANGDILWDGLLMDITAHKQAEEALRQVREELELRVEEKMAQLRQANEQLQFTKFSMDCNPEAIFWIDGNARFFYVNEAASQLLGYSGEELLSMSVHNVDPNFATQHWSKHWKTLKSQGSFTLESTNRAQDGRIFPVEIAVNRLEFNGQEYSCIFVRDISKRKRREEEHNRTQRFLNSLLENLPVAVFVKDSEQQFRSLVENANDIIYQLTPEGVFSYVSPNWVDLLDHEVSEVEGKIFTLFVHPDDLPIWLGSLRRATETGQKQSGIEYRVRHKNGTWRWHISNLSVLREASGRVLSVIGIARDISDRKQAEEALRESEERFRHLVESTNHLIWEVNQKAVYTYVSPQIRDILGYEVEEVLGKTPFDFMPPEEAHCVMEIISNRVALRLPLNNLENQNLHKDGYPVVLEMSGVPFFDKTGNFKGYRGLDRDITKRKQTEEAIQQSKAQLQQQATQLEQTIRQLKNTQSQLIQTEKMSSLGQLVAGVAHEINNPVSFIYGNVNHARRYATDLLNLIELYKETYPQPSPELKAEIEVIDLDFIIEDFPRLLDSMEVGGRRIREIVGSLRNFSRFDEATIKKVDIHQGIDSTLMLLQSRLIQNLIPAAIQVVKEYGNLPLVECYPGHLNQVFMNLLTNAIDALEELKIERLKVEDDTPGVTNAALSEQPSNRQPATPCIRIRTETTQDSTSNPQIVIRIADNGTGMTEETCLKAFDPFFTTKPVGEGTGLGLAISYQIVVELHKGQLLCNSSVGEGTEFVIKIPIHQSSEG